MTLDSITDGIELEGYKLLGSSAPRLLFGIKLFNIAMILHSRSVSMEAPFCSKAVAKREISLCTATLNC